MKVKIKKEKKSKSDSLPKTHFGIIKKKPQNITKQFLKTTANTNETLEDNLKEDIASVKTTLKKWKHENENEALCNSLPKKKKKRHDTKETITIPNGTLEDTKVLVTEEDESMKPTPKEHLNSSNIDDSLSMLWVKYKPKSILHVKASCDWISELLPEPENDEVISLFTRRKLKELAEQMYRHDLQTHYAHQEKYGERRKPHNKLILSHGTSRDKIIQLTLQCTESPIYCLDDLFNLVNFVDPKLRNSSKVAVENITYLFKTTLLSDGYVAKEFECHNFHILPSLIRTNIEQVEKQLILWFFESQVQLAYVQFIENVEKFCHNSVTSVKTFGIRSLHTLLNNHPKQNVELVIQKIVNKLGDTNKQVAGSVQNGTAKLLINHPSLRTTAISYIEELLYRPNISYKAQFYALCVLRDVIFNKNDEELAEKLVKIYFDFFKECAKQGDVDNNFMGALLRGLNRAYPYLDPDKYDFLDDQLATLYKLSHIVNFNLGTQALQLIYQVLSSSDSQITDRFYCVLYRKLLDPFFSKSSASGSFLNLIFKAMVRDTNVVRIRAFFRRLLQVCKYHCPHIVIGILFLISEAIKDNPKLENILQVLLTHQEPHIADSEEFKEELDETLTHEESSSSPNPKRSGRKKSKKKLVKLRSEEVKVEEDETSDPKDLVTKKEKKSFNVTKYDLLARNPLSSGANLSPHWELFDFTSHYHPTVVLFATQLLNQEHVHYTGDPLRDFTLTRFLDRFTQRNPKQIDPEECAAAKVFGSRRGYVPRGTRSIPVDSQSFRSLDKSKIATEDLVFYNYFTQYSRGVKKQKKEDDEESVEDEEFDEYLLKNNDDFRKLKEDEEAEEESEPSDDDDDDEIDFAKNAVAFKEDNVDDYEDEDEEEVGSDDEDEEVEGSDHDEDEKVGSDDEDGEEVGSDDDADALKFEDDEDGLDFDDEGNDFDLEDDDDFDDEFEVPKKRAKKSSSSGDWRSMLVDAEEFSELLEKNAEFDDPFAGTSEAVKIKNKADAMALMRERKGTRRKEYQPRRTKVLKRKTSFGKAQKKIGKGKRK